MKIIFFIFISTLNFAYSQNTISIYYKIGSSKLDNKAKKKINTLLDKLNKTTLYKVTITSSADYLGKTKTNFVLAKKRADNVISYLKNKDTIFKVFNIINKGEIYRIKKNGKGSKLDRKVEISFLNLSCIFNKIAIGQKTILEDIQFKTGKVQLVKKAFSSLKLLVQFLKNNPNIDIEIAGHVCCSAGIIQPDPKKVIKLKALV